ncbi:transcriptional regulator [Streptomyces venezuelae]|uniref:Transcriptional regulator n=1 Tax=Streptomyces venezuelae TaxID=54571 RepID=A0A5P2DNH7_STRVZ|nr:PaaX family transcriptional regulator C-terminal domain-containing protein [Streptomyces venezuelae]QES55748.1 transcriptional regulator [Streptomyces venezuelae]
MSGIPTRMVVHALVREDGTVAGEELYEVAALLGMTDQQVRLCVKRLVTEGRFTAEGRGRRAVLCLAAGAEPGAGPAAGQALVPEVEFVRHAYRQDRGLEPWDGLWHAFAFAVPESARAARDSLRDALTGLGAAPVQGGLYVTPNAIGPYVRAHAAELGLSEALTCLSTGDLTVGGTGGTAGPRALAERLWPLPEIAARYGELRALAELPAEPGRAAGLAHAVTLAAAFSAAMLPDPLLPPELLPQPWPGTTARAAASEAWARLEAAAPAPGPRLFRLYGEALA